MGREKIDSENENIIPFDGKYIQNSPLMTYFENKNVKGDFHSDKTNLKKKVTNLLSNSLRNHLHKKMESTMTHR